MSCDSLAVALPGGLACRTHDLADRRPCNPGSPSSRYGLNKVPLGVGSFLHRLAEQGYRSRIEFMRRIGLVGLEARRKLVCVAEDLFYGSGHRHHLRNFSRATMACTMTIASPPST